MAVKRLALGFGVSAVAALAVALSPAIGAPSDIRTSKPRVTLNGSTGARSDLGSFTPASADPRLAAVLARSGLSTGGFRFTPAATSVRLNRSVTVAVRARTSGTAAPGERTVLASSLGGGIAPIAYNLGVAVGWRRFAVSGDVAKVDLGALGGREAVDVGFSYNAPKFTTRLAVGSDRALPGTPRALINGGDAYSVDLGGSYRLTRNFDLTAGVRYRATERDRLAPLADNRKDSQAVYIGTAFKF